jgi:predicted heme/steroid binding protein
MKSKNALWALIGLLVLVAISALLWFILNSNQSDSPTPQSSSQDSYTLQQVTQKDGKNGNQCWVVVDGTVYEISGFAKWVDGMHTSSAGKASCGRDLSDTINESPHGKSKLKLLKEIGKLRQ